MTRLEFRAEDGHDAVQAERRDGWRSWLRNHHESSSGVWLVTWKATAASRLTYDEADAEALCFDWAVTAQAADRGERANQWTPPADR